MWTKHLNKEDTRQQLELELGFDYDGVTSANVTIASFRWWDCRFNGTVCDVVLSAWGEDETFSARWDTITGWAFEGDEMPEFID